MSQNVRFGLVGDRHTCTTTPGQPGCQITRFFGGSVQYRRPTGLRCWTKVDDYSYRMPWPEAVTDKGPETLGTWVRVVRDLERNANGLVPSDHEMLPKIDAVIDAYLEAVEKLHQLETGQGLMHPDSVVLTSYGSRPEAIFVDVGFTWVGELGEPTWLRDHPGRRTFWDAVPNVQQHTTRLKSADDRASDLAIASKMIAYLVQGGSSSSSAAQQTGPFWRALFARYENASDMRDALRNARASDALTRPPEQKKRLEVTVLDGDESKGRSRLLPIVLPSAVLLLAVAAGAAFLLMPGSTPPTGDVAQTKTTPTEKGTTPTTAAAIKQQPEKTDKSLPKETKELITGGKKLSKDYDTPPTDQAARDKLDADRKEYVQKLDTRLNEIWEAYGKHNNATRAYAELKPLVDQLKELSAKPALTGAAEQTKRENACIAFATELLQQLQQ